MFRINPHLAISLSIATVLLIFLWIGQFHPHPDAEMIRNRTYGLIISMPLIGYVLMSVFFLPLFLGNKSKFEMPDNVNGFTISWGATSLINVTLLYALAIITFFTFAPLMIKYFPGARDTRLWMNITMATVLWGGAGGFSQYRLIEGLFRLDDRQRFILKYGMIAIGVLCMLIPLLCVGFKTFGFEYVLAIFICGLSLGGWHYLVIKAGPFPYYKRGYVPLREQHKRRLKK